MNPIVAAIVASIEANKLSRYVPGMRYIAPDLDSALERIRDLQDKWVAVTALPKCAVLQAVTGRDSVAACGRLAVGQTGSGRVVIGSIPDVIEGSNSAWIDDREALLPMEANRDKHVDDTWVILVMEKDPRTSGFATDPDWFGACAWHIVHQPASEPGLVPVISDDALHPLEEIVR